MSVHSQAVNEIDIDAVTRAIEAVGRDVVLRRFRQLGEADIETKLTPGYPDDMVTVVDREAEAALAERLGELAPGARLIGEELAHGRPDVLALLDDDRPVWIVDPIDGTKNFARGDDRFGIMVSLVVAGEARAAWIVLPARDRVFVAESGSGAYLDGTRIHAPSGGGGPVRGTFSIRFMPEALRDAVLARVQGRFAAGPFSGCSAIEYTAVLQGDADFVVYYRLLPWDHAAPALILTEAGGRVEHRDGRPYTPRSTNQLTIAGRSAGVSALVRSWLDA
ncbi:MAG: inositol monophosphatase [Acidobacteria bacterium]|nr:inositol monophosphatase [Acidobacteriota bacterium]